MEALEFQERLAAFDARNTSVAGVSPDGLESHRKFREKHGFTFPLLSDPDKAVLKAYGAFGEKISYGKKTQGVIRSTAVIGPDGRIEAFYHNVKAQGHAQTVLDALER